MNVLVCPLSDPGYLYPALAIGRALAARGHRVTVLGSPAALPAITEAGLPPMIVLPEDAPGFAVGRWFSAGHRQFRSVLAAITATGPDVVLTSVLAHGSLLAAQVTGVPVVVTGFAAHIWTYADDAAPEPEPAPGVDGAPAGELRRWRTSVTLGRYHGLRRRLGLAPAGEGLSPLLGSAFLLRGHPALEVPGARLPAGVEHVGPCAWEPAAPPGEVARLTTTPFVYVHLGRDFGGDTLWPRLNAAFIGTGLRAVVEQGRSGPAVPAPAAAVTVIRRPWMAPLVARASAVLASGTSAPVLAALTAGTPLVLAPSGSEQPVLTAACVRAGVAVELPRSPGPGLARSIRAAPRDIRLTLPDGAQRAADVLDRVAGGLNRSRTAAEAGANPPSRP